MKSPYSFIVKPYNNKRYDNTKKYGETDFIISTSEEDHSASNRYAVVVSTPIDYSGPVKEGDTLLVHHNVFKFYNDMQGRRKSGKSYFKDDLFFVDPDQFFLYKQNKEWKGYNKYCFIKPSASKDSFIKKSITEEPLFGTIKYINDQLLSMGLKVGDEISYQPESEYEFNVDGERLYRMFTNNITFSL
jgi:hypothetical protein|tara:strand:+ start:2299 stop:2862 length:564 start_codon:yes stop_codon:yes gene_type:complete